MQIEAVALSLTSSLSRRDDEQTVAVELYRLMASFPQRDGQAEASTEMRVDGYFTAIGDLPAWAIRKAVDDVLRGVSGLDKRWAPTPPQLAELVRKRMEEPARAELTLRRLLDAKVELPEPTEEERERRAKQVEKLVGSLKRTAA